MTSIGAWTHWNNKRMALLQISEPGGAPDPHQRRIAVGIDLGTTHSLVAAVRHGVAECLPDAPAASSCRRRSVSLGGLRDVSALCWRGCELSPQPFLSVKRLWVVADHIEGRDRLP